MGYRLAVVVANVSQMFAEMNHKGQGQMRVCVRACVHARACVCVCACTHLYLFIIMWADCVPPNFLHFNNTVFNVRINSEHFLHQLFLAYCLLYFILLLLSIFLH